MRKLICWWILLLGTLSCHENISTSPHEHEDMNSQLETTVEINVQRGDESEDDDEIDGQVDEQETDGQVDEQVNRQSDNEQEMNQNRMGCDAPNPSLTCLAGGCPQGQNCLPRDHCVPSHCSCNEQINESVCSTDCQTDFQCTDGNVYQYCGFMNLPPCPFGQYCQYADESICGTINPVGVCIQLNPNIICSEQRSLVCGCNQVTYANRCVAYSLGISVAYMGACGGL